MSSFGHPISKFSHRKYCTNRLFVEIVLKKFRSVFLVFLGGFGNCFSDFSGLDNKLENRTIFMKSRIQTTRSAYADPGVFGLSKNIKDYANRWIAMIANR